METALSVKLQSQCRNTGCTLDHTQDMRMIVRHQEEPSIAEKIEAVDTLIDNLEKIKSNS